MFLYMCFYVLNVHKTFFMYFLHLVPTLDHNVKGSLLILQHKPYLACRVPGLSRGEAPRVGGEGAGRGGGAGEGRRGPGARCQTPWGPRRGRRDTSLPACSSHALRDAGS